MQDNPENFASLGIEPGIDQCALALAKLYCGRDDADKSLAKILFAAARIRAKGMPRQVLAYSHSEHDFGPEAWALRSDGLCCYLDSSCAPYDEEGNPGPAEPSFFAGAFTDKTPFHAMCGLACCEILRPCPGDGPEAGPEGDLIGQAAASFLGKPFATRPADPMAGLRPEETSACALIARDPASLRPLLFACACHGARLSGYGYCATYASSSLDHKNVRTFALRYDGAALLASCRYGPEFSMPSASNAELFWTDELCYLAMGSRQVPGGWASPHDDGFFGNCQGALQSSMEKGLLEASASQSSPSPAPLPRRRM